MANAETLQPLCPDGKRTGSLSYKRVQTPSCAASSVLTPLRYCWNPSCNLVGLLKFRPKPWFEPQTSEPDLRFLFSMVPVHRSVSGSSSRFLARCSMENQFRTSLNCEPHSGESEYWFWPLYAKQEQSAVNTEKQWDVKIWQELMVLKQ